MRKLLAVLAVLAALSLMVAATSFAQGPVERPNMPGAPRFQDENGDGVCDVCGNAAPGQMSRRGGMMGQGGMMGRGGMMGTSLLSTVAEALDMSVQDVWAEAQEGKTLRQVIVDHQGDADAIVAKFVETRKAALDQAVEQKRITQEQADLMLEHMRGQVVQQLDQTELGCGMGRWNGETPNTGTFGGRIRRGIMRWGKSA